MLATRRYLASVCAFLEHYIYSFYFFFFSSRRRHTRLQGDWSSDVCSSDLPVDYPELGGNVRSCSTTGTYRGYTNTGESELTIAGNGEATIRSLSSNALYSGRCANDVLYFDWGAFNVVREGRNISSVEISNPLNRTTFRRVSGNQGDYGQRNPDQRYPDQRYPNQNYPNQNYPNQNYPNQNYPDQVG